MALFKNKGYTVQPFKCGPDYIDTKFHETVCGRPSINLDTFMATPAHVRVLFRRYAEGADLCIAEGMMGLFDGYDRDLGSTADVARVLGLPVVLVVDARSASYSLAPLLKGFACFRPDVRVAGVIFNKVGSERHYQMLRQVCSDLGMECFGYLPKQEAMEQGSRYLGLDFSKQVGSAGLVKALEEHVDWRRLLETMTSAPCEPSLSESVDECSIPTFGQSGKVLVARNAESFSFIYQEVIDRFPRVSFFNPETDVPQLDDTDLLYLPGGYPEKHLDALVKAESTRQAIRDYAERGGRIIAECGGMMYLCNQIVDDEGVHPMCGLLPYTISARKQDRKLSLGYRYFELEGKTYRGHEFHYTQFLGETPVSCCQVYNAKGEPVATPVLRYKNVLASYTHLYQLCGEGRKEREDDNHVKEEKGRGDGRLKPIMFAGTGSDVGKSVVAAAFCRIFLQDGYHPAPFKAQNMALNSYATSDGLEIGRAQAVQAEAAGVPCHTDMNPLLLKPQSDHTSQVVLNGRPVGNRDAYHFFREKSNSFHSSLREEVCSAFDRLAARYNPIVMEGAGSISEINLRDTDLVNMPMAQHAHAAVILVADIDRGGVFASVYGSIALQKPEDRQLIKGIIINKFRGDLRLFDSGRHMLEKLCGVPVLGVIPYFNDIHIEEEDSVSLAGKQHHSLLSRSNRVNAAVVMLRHLSNFTDFDVLEHDDRVHLYYTNNLDEISKADIIIVPGSKSTLDDLYELRRNGVAQAIVRAQRNGTTVIGICGGFQMMGVEVTDPDHVEGEIERLPGLGLLPVTTTMSGEKITRQSTFRLTHHRSNPIGEEETYPLSGYEIHMGHTTPFGDAEHQPFALLGDGRTDGYRVSDRCWGTYLHGVLDNRDVVDLLLAPFADRLAKDAAPLDYAAFKDEQFNLLADHVRKHVDLERVYQIMRDE